MEDDACETFAYGEDASVGARSRATSLAGSDTESEFNWVPKSPSTETRGDLRTHAIATPQNQKVKQKGVGGVGLVSSLWQ